MLIDWFTVIAQAINFLILVVLMRHFLYKPILHAIDEREILIAAKLQEADIKVDTAIKMRDDLDNRIKDFEDQEDKRHRELEREIQVERERLLNAVRKEVEAARKKWHRNLDSETHQLQKEFIQKTHSEALAITRKTLNELADIQLESQLVKVFVKKISTLSQEKREELKSSLKGPRNEITINSAYELTSFQMETIEKALIDCLGIEVKIKLNVRPKLTCGIELSFNGKKIAWSIEGYLDSLTNNINNIARLQ